MTGRYCVLIPAYNAEHTVGTLVRCTKQQGFPVVVVDDGSTDRTASVASKEGALVISHLQNQGKGRALRTGFEHIARGDYDGVITMDSDGQHDPGEIPHLIREGERQHAGIVVGNRMQNERAMPFVRRWANRAMSAIISRLSRQHIPDTQCGFRLIRKEVIASLPLTADHFDIETDMLLAAAQLRWKTISIPVQTIYQGRQSYIHPVRDTLRFLRLIGKYAVHRTRK